MEQSSRAEVVQRVENLVKVMKTMVAMLKMAMTKGEMMTMKKGGNDDKAVNDDKDDDDNNCFRSRSRLWTLIEGSHHFHRCSHFSHQ